MSDDRARVLVLDDDDAVRRALTRLIGAMGFAVTPVVTGLEAIATVETEPFAVAVIDLDLPDLHGFEVLARIRALRPEVECVILTGSDAKPSEARARGASDYFQKPLDDTERFAQVIRRACEVFRLRQAVVRLEPLSSPSPIEGRSAAMHHVRALVDRMGSANAPVLITGESGSGKEVVAQALHDRSQAPGEFVRINVAAMPTSLIEAELFGAEEGTFTGQRGRRVGLLTVADRGTLFLDEIGDMPLELQPKLLRVLENRTYRPLGARAERELTARILTATHVDLERAVKAGKFREDLYFRLAVLKIDIPPLRDRADDVAYLARYFVRKYALAAGQHVPEIAPDTLASLEAHTWPGNVRELANACQRALVLGSGDRLELADFGVAAPARRAAAPPPAHGSDPFAPYLDLPLREAKDRLLSAFMAAYLTRRVALAQGNITHAADAAGMLRPNFRRELKRYGVFDAVERD